MGGGQAPQSAAQLEQLSPAWQTPLPQTGPWQLPQSSAQLEQVSAPLQSPSPQNP
jgi:hypothetical protein